MIVIAVFSIAMAIAIPVLSTAYISSTGGIDKWPSECGTDLKVLSNDVSEHNASKIAEILHDKLSKLNDPSLGLYGDWWNYVRVGQPDEKGVFTISMPGSAWGQTEKYNDFIVNELEDLEQVSKVLAAPAWCN